MQTVKKIRIPKNHSWTVEDLTCPAITVNGRLTITGELTTGHIRGRGIIKARSIRAKTISCRELEVERITADRMRTYSANAGEVTLGGGYTPRCERTPDASEKLESSGTPEPDVETMPAENGTRDADMDISAETENATISYGSDKDSSAAATTDTANAVSSDSGAVSEHTSLTEAQRLLDDPSFLRLRAMHRLERNYGCMWLLKTRSETPSRPEILSERVGISQSESTERERAKQQYRHMSAMLSKMRGEDENIA
jgi:hypothetical protein